VRQHHLGPEQADPSRHLAAQRHATLEFAVGLLEEHHLSLGPECSGSSALLIPSGGDQGGYVGVGVPCALGAVGAHEVMYDAPSRCPLGQRAAGPELDIVGVRPDCEGDRGRREIA